MATRGWFTYQEGWAEGGGAARFVPLADWERAHRTDLEGVSKLKIDPARRVIDTETGEVLSRRVAEDTFHGVKDYFEQKAASRRRSGVENPQAKHTEFVKRYTERFGGPKRGNKEMEELYKSYKKEWKVTGKAKISDHDWVLLRSLYPHEGPPVGPIEGETP